MYQLLLIIHVLVAVCIVALVLVQQGKGASVGAAFGSGASQTVFGSRGSGSFLLRVTVGFAVVFFITSLSLNYMANKSMKEAQALSMPAPLPQEAPAADKTINPNTIPLSTSEQGKK